MRKAETDYPLDLPGLRFFVTVRRRRGLYHDGGNEAEGKSSGLKEKEERTWAITHSKIE